MYFEFFIIPTLIKYNYIDYKKYIWHSDYTIITYEANFEKVYWTQNLVESSVLFSHKKNYETITA